MPVLPNPKHERFCQEIAKGINQTIAYKTAGYQTNAKAAGVSASRLMEQPSIKARVAELLEQRDKMLVKATARAAERLSIDREWVLAKLIAQHDKAAAMEDSAPAVNAALRALELLGKELGMFIERHEVGGPGDFARMSDEELRDLVARALMPAHSETVN